MKTTQELQTLLASTYVLYTKTQHFHWNVTGERFAMLHQFFEGQYENLAEANDELAERVRMLGEYALGTHDAFNKHSILKEQSKVPSADGMLKELLADHEAMIDQLSSSIAKFAEKNDEGTADLLTARLRWHQKTAWMIRSHLV